MAVLFVGFWLILTIAVLGLFERFLCVVFPFLKVLKYIILLAGWPVAVWYIVTQDNCYQPCFVEQFIWATVVTVIYWLIVVTIKLLLVPLDVLVQPLKSTKK